MPGEIQQLDWTTAKVMYAVMRSATATAVKTSDGSLVTYVTADLAQYTIALTEQGTASRFYAGDVPAGVASGVYSYKCYEQIGGAPAESDTFAGGGTIEWSGTAVVSLDSRTKPADTQAAVTNLTNAPTNGDLTAAMKASVTAAVPTAAANAAAVQTALDSAHGAGSWAATAVPANFTALIISAGGVVSADAVAIAGSAPAAVNQKDAALAIYRGTVTGAATIATLIDSGLTMGDVDQIKGRVVIFLPGSSLPYEPAEITAFDPVTDQITFTALSQAPAPGDAYVIV